VATTRTRVREPAEATVEEVMTHVIVTVDPDETLEGVADLFRNRGITGAPVVSREGEVLGIVSTTDLLGALQKGEPCTVLDIATRRVVSIDETASLAEAAKVLLELGIHRLLVTRNGKRAGILTATDVLKWVARPALQADRSAS
jgi:IMP dehydrogenase